MAVMPNIPWLMHAIVFAFPPFIAMLKLRHYYAPVSSDIER
jgi:hypothetical protein